MNWIKRLFWCWRFNRMPIAEKRLARAMEIDPDSLIRKGHL